MVHQQDDRKDPITNEFQQAGQRKQLSLAHEFLAFLMESKKWWLLPILLVLGMAGLLVVLGSTGAAPFIYALF
jgi:hypothetical protein